MLRCPSPAYAIEYGACCSIWSLCAEIVVLHFLSSLKTSFPQKSFMFSSSKSRGDLVSFENRCMSSSLSHLTRVINMNTIFRRANVQFDGCGTKTSAVRQTTARFRNRVVKASARVSYRPSNGRFPLHVCSIQLPECLS